MKMSKIQKKQEIFQIIENNLSFLHYQVYNINKIKILKNSSKKYQLRSNKKYYQKNKSCPQSQSKFFLSLKKIKLKLRSIEFAISIDIQMMYKFQLYYINFKMKYLLLYYCVNVIVLICSFLFFSLSNVQKSQSPIQQIVIIGCNFESSALSYYLKNKNKNINITIIEQQQCHYDEYFTFIEGSVHVKSLLNEINFKYEKINENQGFWNGEELIVKNENLYSSLYKYGLSSYALKYVLNQFQKKIAHGLNKYHFKNVQDILIHLNENIKETPVKYFLEHLGLDRQYVKNIIYSFIYGNYLQNFDMNLFNIKLKLLQLFNTKYQTIGTESDLVFRLVQDTIINQKQQIKEIKRDQNNYIIINTNKAQYNVSKIIFNNKTSTQFKEGYYISIVKGIINPNYYHRDRLPTTIYAAQNTAKIQNLCLVRCKRQHQNMYIVQSKNKLSEKDLKMFKESQIIKATKYKMQKYIYQQNYKLNDGNGVFYLNPLYLLTDNKQFILEVTKYLSEIILNKK